MHLHHLFPEEIVAHGVLVETCKGCGHEELPMVEGDDFTRSEGMELKKEWACGKAPIVRTQLA